MSQLSLYFLYCVRYLVFFVFFLSYLFGCYHFLMNKDIYIYIYNCKRSITVFLLLTFD